MSPGPRTTAIVLAAGLGERVGGEAPKQFLDLAGRLVISYSIEALAGHPLIDAIVVVLPSSRPNSIKEVIDRSEVVSVTEGGPTRQASLSNGLVCVPEQSELVLVQDAARPLITSSVIDRVIEGVGGQYKGAIAALQLDDALKEVSVSGEILSAKPRRIFWRAQTPQAFVRESLEDAIARADADQHIAEDCSEMLTRVGYRVKVVAGDPWNIKITRPQDISLCERIIAARNSAREASF